MRLRHFIGGGIAVLLLWVGAMILTPKIATIFLDPNASTPGIFGDMFGAINSLFSGMALIGVVASLWIQVRQASREKKPFLVPLLQDEDGANLSIGQPKTENAELHFPLSGIVQLSNKGEEAALNAAVQVVLSFANKTELSETFFARMPMIRGEVVDFSFRMGIVGSLASELADALDSQEPPRLRVHVRYENIMSVVFLSEVVYSLKMMPEDLGKFRKWLTPSTTEGDERSPFVGMGSVRVRHEVAPGSWKYVEQ